MLLTIINLVKKDFLFQFSLSGLIIIIQNTVHRLNICFKGIMGFLSLGISGRNLGLLTILMHFIDKNPSSQRIEKQANEPSLIFGNN